VPPTSALLAHTDLLSAFDRAIGNGKGVRVHCGDHGDVVNLRQRAYRARELDRKENRKVYAPDDPMYGRSVYDSLIFIPRSNDEDGWFLYIEVSSPQRLEEVMEDL
jgi:hypothetical protein